jgi:hypothetical protein
MNYRSIIESLTGNAEFTLDRLNTAAGNIVFRAAPLLAPVPSAIAVFNALAPRYGWLSALVLALVVEGLGYAAAELALRVWSLNRALERIQVAQWMPNAMFIVYFAAALATIFGFETLPAIMAQMDGAITRAELATHVAPLVYPFLTVVGAGIYGIRILVDDGNGEIERQATRAQSAVDFEEDKCRAEWELKMEQRRAEHAAKLAAAERRLDAKLSNHVSNGSVKSPSNLTPNHSSDRQSALLDILQSLDSVDDINKTALARQFGVTRQTIYNDLESLHRDKRLSLNGHAKG